MDGGCVRAAGKPPRRFAPPLPRGEFGRKMRRDRTTAPNPRPIPLLGGVPPQGRGGSPPQRT
ncbi:MAG: hypothetical protein LBM98_06845 [Oscillospiraceae bacterium]|nr:hypothetical protein [Oscillospiraceae bacterium]